MDIDTIIILGLLATAFSWWFSILVKEERLLTEQNNKSAMKNRERMQRIKRLTKKL